MAKQSSTPKVVTKKHIARLERERRQISLIRGIAIGGLILVVGLLVYGYLQMNVLSKQQSVAEVNGDKITSGQWQERVRIERVSLYNQLNQYQYFQQAFGMDTSQQLQSIQAQLESPETMGDSVLNPMIDEVLHPPGSQETRHHGQRRGSGQVHPGSLWLLPGWHPDPTVTPTEYCLSNSFGRAAQDLSPHFDAHHRADNHA